MKLSDFRDKPGVEFTWGNGYTRWRFITSNNLEENVNERGWETDYEVPLNLALRDDLREVQKELKVERWSFAVEYAGGGTAVYSCMRHEAAQQTHEKLCSRGHRCSKIQRNEYIIK